MCKAVLIKKRKNYLKITYTFLSATINAAGVRYAVKYAIALTKNDPIP